MTSSSPGYAGGHDAWAWDGSGFMGTGLGTGMGAVARTWVRFRSGSRSDPDPLLDGTGRRSIPAASVVRSRLRLLQPPQQTTRLSGWLSPSGSTWSNVPRIGLRRSDHRT